MLKQVLAVTTCLVIAAAHSSAQAQARRINQTDVTQALGFTPLAPGSDISGQHVTVNGNSVRLGDLASGVAPFSATQIVSPSGVGPAEATTQNLTGTVSAAQNYANNHYIASDNINLGSGFSVGWNHAMLFGGSAAQGGRVGLNAYIILTSPTNASNANRNYVGLQGGASDLGTTGDGGTNLTTDARGGMFGFSTYVRLGGQNYLNATGGEVNTFMLAGSSVKYKSVLQLVGGGSTDAVQGSLYDVVLALSDQAGSVGHNDGILFGPMNGQFPVVAGGSLIRTIGGTVATGIDLTTTSFAGNAIQTPGFRVDPAGDVYSPGHTVSTLVVNKQITTGGSAPTISGCGTSPTVSGNTTAGSVAPGSGTVTSCVITFASPMASNARCIANATTSSGIPVAVAPTILNSSGVQFTAASSIAGGSLTYICMQ